MFSVARSRADRTARASGDGAAGDGDPRDVLRSRPRRAVQRSGRGGTGLLRARGSGRRHDRRAGDDERRRGAAAARLSPRPARSLPSARGLPRVRRGEDRLHDRGAAPSRRSAFSPTSWRSRKPSAAACRAARSGRPRSKGPVSAASTTSRQCSRQPADDGRGAATPSRSSPRRLRAPERARSKLLKDGIRPIDIGNGSPRT